LQSKRLHQSPNLESSRAAPYNASSHKKQKRASSFYPNPYQRNCSDDIIDTESWMRVATEIRQAVALRAVVLPALPQRKPRRSRRREVSAGEASTSALASTISTK
jgi:hypothetical protein